MQIPVFTSSRFKTGHVVLPAKVVFFALKPVSTIVSKYVDIFSFRENDGRYVLIPRTIIHRFEPNNSA